MRRVLIFVAIAAAVAAGAAWPAARSSTPQTVLTLSTPMDAFAADGARMAWMVDDDTCGVLVRSRPIAGGPVTTLTTPKGETCQNGNGQNGPGDLVLAGSHALFTTYSASNEEDDADVTLGIPGKPDKGLWLVGWQGGIDAGDHTVPSVPMAGGGSTLVYADNGDIGSRGELYRAVSPKCCRVGTVNGVRALAVGGSRIAAAVTTPAGAALSDDPVWFAGGRIGFDSFRDGNTGIYTVSSSGGAWKLVRESVDEGIGSPAWSPDGHHIAYISLFELFVMNADGRRPRLVESTHEAVDPSWTPDGKRLVWSNGDDGSLWTTVLATGKSSLLLKVGSDDLERPAVAPGGTRIAYHDQDKSQLIVSALNGANRTVIGSGTDPAWSPDGSLIASSTCKIVVSAPDGSGAHEITTPPAKQCDLHPSWSPDGSQIVFSRGQTDITADLYVVNADGTGLRRLTTTVPVPAKDEVRLVNGAGKPAGAVIPVRASRVLLSGRTLVLLTTAALEVRDAVSGRLLRKLFAHGRVLSLAFSGHRLVYYAGGALWLSDTGTGKTTRLLATPPPVGLGISKQRVVWAESGRKSSRVRELTVP
jgi:TolB protein